MVIASKTALAFTVVILWRACVAHATVRQVWRSVLSHFQGGSRYQIRAIKPDQQVPASAEPSLQLSFLFTTDDILMYFL